MAISQPLPEPRVSTPGRRAGVPRLDAVPAAAPTRPASARQGGPLTSVREHPSALLLLAQLGAVIAYPFCGTSRTGLAVVNVVSIVVVAFALYAVRRSPALTVVAVVLGVPALVLAVIEAVDPGNGGVVLASACFHAPFYFYVSYGQLRYLFGDDRVTRDELFATAAAFTVVAWGFTYLYAAVEVIWPGSFSGDAHPSWFELLYLSFTTLSNTGLSDIAPGMPHAQSISIVEEVTGVFYIGLVIARLVGLTVRSRSDG